VHVDKEKRKNVWKRRYEEYEKNKKKY